MPNLSTNISGGGVTSTTDLVVASVTTTGAIVAGTTVTGGTGLVATTGNVVANSGQVQSASLATTGAITAGTTVTGGTGVTATTGDVAAAAGNVTGAIIRGSTALEYPAHATLPTVRCTTDTGVGIGRTASATVSAFGSTGILLPAPVTVTGALTASGRVTGAGYYSSINGTASAPAYSWSSRTGDGLFNEVSRMSLAFGGNDKAYWGSINHNYQTVDGNGGAVFSGQLSAGGLVLPRSSKTANYTMSGTDYFVTFDSSAGAITVTLPAVASSAGFIYAIKKVVASANAVTIDPNGSETINGALTLVVADNTAVIIECDGTGWQTISAS